jgi:DDE family transposase
MAALSLVEVLAEVPDPRSRHGRIHPLPAILALTVLAMLHGCRVRKGTAPQVLAAVRNAVIHLLAGVDAPSNAAALRRLNNHPEEALALLDLPQL